MFEPFDPNRTQVWSCGGGTQSAAIAALIVQERLPRPDIAVMVDTGREKSATWRYAEAVLIPELAQAGVTLEIIRKEDFATVDLYRENEETGEEDLLLPVYTSLNLKANGELGKMPTFCSNEWKQRVVRRWLRRVREVTACEQWIGYSLDERKRLKAPDCRWLKPRYPLVQDVPLHRHGCVLVVTEMGWPEPPRSACWMCSNMSDREWREMKESDPQDFAKAVALDYSIRERDPHFYIHESGLPLDQVVFSAEREKPSLFGCDSGMCFV